MKSSLYLEISAGQENFSVRREFVVLRRVDVLVAFVSAEIVVALPQHRDERHEGKWAPVRVERTDLEDRNKLEIKVLPKSSLSFK